MPPDYCHGSFYLTYAGDLNHDGYEDLVRVRTDDVTQICSSDSHKTVELNLKEITGFTVSTIKKGLYKDSILYEDYDYSGWPDYWQIKDGKGITFGSVSSFDYTSQHYVAQSTIEFEDAIWTAIAKMIKHVEECYENSGWGWGCDIEH